MLISAHECFMFGEASRGEDLSVWSPPTQSGSGDPGTPPTDTPITRCLEGKEAVLFCCIMCERRGGTDSSNNQ